MRQELAATPPRTATAVSLSSRLSLTIGVALVSGLLAYLRLSSAGIVAADFTWALRGAQLLLQGVNPYAAIQPEGIYPFDDYLFYPLPALLVALPLAPLPGPLAGAIFFGLASGLLCWGLLPGGAYRLLTFVSAPYLYALLNIQWSPLLTAAALLPALSFVLPAKPNLGLAILVAYPERRRFLLAGLMLAISFVVMPGWPLAMFGVLAAHKNHVPLLQWFGPLLLLALLFWRSANARLLLVLACMPQRLVYDQLPLWLVPQTSRQVVMLWAASWVSFGLGLALGTSWALAATYLAALACIGLQERPAISRWAARLRRAGRPIGTEHDD